MKLSLARKRLIREHIRDAGFDPAAMSPTDFIQYARDHGLLDTPAKPAATAANAKPAKTDKPTVTDDDAPTTTTKTAAAPADDRLQRKPMPSPTDYDMTTAEGAQQFAQDMRDAKAHNDMIDAAAEQHAAMQQQIKRLQQEAEAAREQAKDNDVKTLVIERPDTDAEPVTIDQPHSMLETVLKLLSNGLNVYMAGPAGSGKTTLATQCAKALDATFYFTGKLAEEYQLLGYKDGNGNYVETEFYKACTSDKPAVFLFDEFDDSESKAVTKFNAALANRFMDFPCGRVEIPDHVHFIAAGNTAGKGGNRTYLRNQLDGATMDRFVFIAVDYDLKLERRLALSRNANAGEWVDWVQAARAKADAAGLNMVISPRASINGAVMLAAGFTMDECKHMTVFKGASEDQIAALS